MKTLRLAVDAWRSQFRFLEGIDRHRRRISSRGAAPWPFPRRLSTDSVRMRLIPKRSPKSLLPSSVRHGIRSSCMSSDREMLDCVAARVPPYAARCPMRSPYRSLLAWPACAAAAASSRCSARSYSRSTPGRRAHAATPRRPRPDPRRRPAHRRAQRQHLRPHQSHVGRHVVEDLDGRIDAILDSGETTHGLESTVVNPNEDPCIVYRPGVITLEQIRAAGVDAVAYRESGAAAEAEPESLPSPGIAVRHYAPRARAYSCRWRG